MRRLKAWLRRLLTGSSPGFTLAEVLVSVSILGVTTGLMGSGIFQSLAIVRYWQEDVTARREVRQALSWFSTDAVNVTTTDLVGGAAPVTSATISWTDSAGAPHTVTYSLAGDRLGRSYDGNAITVARRVTALEFSRSGKMLRLSIGVSASRGATEARSLEVYGRMLQ